MNCFRKANNNYLCKIVLLDGQELTQDIRDDTLGQELSDSVFRHLHLRETAYFGLRFVHTTQQPLWLNPNKKAAKQLKGTDPFILYFCVKFYATEPCKLLDEITRYQFFLQVKKDIVDGRLPVRGELASELGAYVAQSELGDHDPSAHQPGYCAEFQLGMAPAAGDGGIAALHRTLTGQAPAAVESAFLEKVRWLEMYGADLHPVLGDQQTESFIGLAPSGVLVLKGKGKISNYFWPRITKVFCKKNYFMLRVRDKDSEEHTFGFQAPSRTACRLLLQHCVEQRDFFRQARAGPPAGAATSHGGRSESRREASATVHQRQAGRRAGAGLQPPPNTQQALPRSDSDADTPSICHKKVSVPQPVQSASALYRASSVHLQSKTPPDSPRSAHSAAGSASRLSGLFSAGQLTKARSRASIDSQSSADSRTQRRSRHRRESSVASDASSGQSSLRSSRRYRGRRAESGSDSDRSGGSRRHRSRRHRHQQSNCELVDSEPQWREVQRLQAERLRPSGYQNSGMETETELSYQPKRRVKKHSRSRSRSRSPETGRNRRLPAELRRHLQFGLVDPTADNVGDIPYTKVTTELRMPRIRYAAKRSQRSDSTTDQKWDGGADQPAAASVSERLPPEGAIAPTAAYPPPAPPRPTTGNTLSSYYVRSVPSDRARPATTPAALDRTVPGEPASAAVTVTRGQVTRTTEQQYDNSDSGLGNESPIEFSRR
ncbi:band 4.1-like protein 4 isoform X2 [Pollicipes pollicipes]|uniref:band 4.1-like protein 4 isoform X2 n=1 Tax=Pollicipes pollicipes TaxID=41117 RepID=UPI0018858614|nr:band 4.1-like protein 4 isoform X2 [Pollicipes pollicipes]